MVSFERLLLLAQTVALFAAAAAGILAAWQARRAHVAVTRVELSMNGRLSEFMRVATAAARAEGFIGGVASTVPATGVESTRDKPAEPEPHAAS